MGSKKILPMRSEYLQTVTQLIMKGNAIMFTKLKNNLYNVSTDIISNALSTYSHKYNNEFLITKETEIIESPSLFENTMEKTILDDEYADWINNYNLMNYQIDFFNELCSRVEVKNKKILEIGGSNMPNQLIIDKLGVKNWVSVDKPWQVHLDVWKTHYKSIPQFNFLDHGNVDETLSKYRYVIYNEYAENIPDSFFEQFDVCISNCSFEHINNLVTVLNRIYNSLKKVGNFILDLAQYGLV